MRISKTLVIIPARGGSKGVIKKNMRLLNGIPLISYTINIARQVFLDSQICVSTDCSEIKKYTESQGLNVPFIRPSEIAQDATDMRSVILHALDFYNNIGYDFDCVLLLQPTSPFRTTDHIRKALELYKSSVDMVLSVTKTDCNPYFNLFEELKDGILVKSKVGNFTNRQSAPVIYKANGSIYVINGESLRNSTISDFKKIVKYEMDELHSVDIDTEFDLFLAENYLRGSNAL
jgi:CMP-N,N'-diacetyllegionaminic acid synthase